MTHARQAQPAPLASVIVPAAGPGEVARAARSAYEQTYTNIQILIAGPGPDARRAAAAAGDERAVALPAPTPCSTAAAINLALQHAAGRYVCYLEPHAVYYPHHVQSLTAALEAGDGGAAYSDVYHTTVRTGPDAAPQILAKAAGGRAFDRFRLLHRADLPPTALMHRRDLLDRTGPWRDGLGDLAGWDFLRRLAFYTDFAHVPQITAEIATPDRGGPAPAAASPAEKARRLAERSLAVRQARPAKPWPKIKDLSVLLAPRRADDATADRIDQIRRWTFWPHEIYVAVPPGGPVPIAQLGPNVVGVPVEPACPWDARVDKALRACGGDLAAVADAEMPVGPDWLDPAAHALSRDDRPDQARLLSDARSGAWAAVFRTDELRRARRRYPALSVRRSAEADGIDLRRPAPAELPCAFDGAMARGQNAERDGNFTQAAGIYRDAAGQDPPGNELHALHAAAAALYRDGRNDGRALATCRRINGRRPTVETLLLEARLLRRNGHGEQAVQVLQMARQVLDGTDQVKGPTC